MKPDLAALIAYWQKALRLQDWRIVASYVKNLCDPGGREVWGLCCPLVDNKSAQIAIRDPSTPPSGATSKEAAAQVEETVIHELLHLHFAPFGTAAPAEIAAEENAVWAISEALHRKKGTGKEYKIARAMLANVTRTRRQRKTMDPKRFQEALDALTSGDTEKCAEILKAIMAEAASGGAPAADPGDMAADAEPGAGKPGDNMAADAEPGADPNKGRRSRNAAEAPHVARMSAAAGTMTREALRAMVHNARTIDGIDLPVNVEQAILKAPTLAAGTELLSTAKAMAAAYAKKPGTAPANAGNGAQHGSNAARRRSGAEPAANESEPEGLTGAQRRLRHGLKSRGRDDLIDKVRPRAAK